MKRCKKSLPVLKNGQPLPGPFLPVIPASTSPSPFLSTEKKQTEKINCVSSVRWKVRLRPGQNTTPYYWHCVGLTDTSCIPPSCPHSSPALIVVLLWYLEHQKGGPHGKARLFAKSCRKLRYKRKTWKNESDTRTSRMNYDSLKKIAAAMRRVICQFINWVVNWMQGPWNAIGKKKQHNWRSTGSKRKLSATLFPTSIPDRFIWESVPASQCSGSKVLRKP